MSLLCTQAVAGLQPRSVSEVMMSIRAQSHAALDPRTGDVKFVSGVPRCSAFHGGEEPGAGLPPTKKQTLSLVANSFFADIC